MDAHPTMLVDPGRAALIAGLSGRGLFKHADQVWADGSGTQWAVVALETTAVAVSSRGPGWLSVPGAREKDPAEWDDVSARARVASPAERRAALDRHARSVRTGALLSRFLWELHRQVLGRKTSVLQLADRELGTACYGPDPDAWPRHWRQEVFAAAWTAEMLHFGVAGPGGGGSFGERSAVLLHVGDLKGTDEDRCGPDCGWYGRGRHHHLLVHVGPGLLGSLEAFATDAGGVRSYRLASTGRKGTVTLRDLARRQEVRGIYVPAYLGDPAVTRRYSPSQLWLIQALIRELTRRNAKTRDEAGLPLLLTGPKIPGFNGRGAVVCPALLTGTEYVTFGGNGYRRGLGYKLLSPQGWATRSGYAVEEAAHFAADLGVLARRLDLIPVAVARSGRVYSLAEITALCGTRVGREALAPTDVRVYTRSDFLDRWSAHFRWPSAPAAAVGDTVELAVLLTVARVGRGKTQGQVAAELGLDPSFLSRLIGGKASWPPSVVERVRRWIEGNGELGRDATGAAACGSQ